jgi:molybdenum cofactor synthesis domain-containing protein
MPAAAPVRAAVLTVSDAGARGERADTSGDVICSRLEGLPATLVSRRIVPDERDAIRAAVVDATAAAGLLVITGGTGVGPRDVTPQSVGPLLDYEVPGMAEAMRLRGLASTPHAMLSRQVVGVRGGCLVLSLPGSPRAVAECLDAVWEALPHALRLLAGERPCHQPPGGQR